MTPGQQRALRELQRLQLVGDGAIECDDPTVDDHGYVWVDVSVRIGPVEKREGGLDLNDRESISVAIPKDFPFKRPTTKLQHARFKGFPHVTWGRYICLYQSELEWNPSDGMYGYFTRLAQWFGRAAANDMDPIEGPLEPPLLIPDFTKKPFLISVNSPVATGTFWIGLAEFVEHPNQIEVTRWVDNPDEPRTPGTDVALVVILRKRLPMEFPRYGEDFFAVLAEQGVERETMTAMLQLAAAYGKEADPVYLMLGSPALRSPTGQPKHHFAVWSTDRRKGLRLSVPSESDAEETARLRAELSNAIMKVFDASPLTWIRVLDGRSEIAVRRDQGSPMAWFAEKRVLLLGCGALGSWAAELIARANPTALTLVDNGIVKPGLLVRQNFTKRDVGLSKVEALERRLLDLGANGIDIHYGDALDFIRSEPERLSEYDVIIDCTASRTFQMQLESIWGELVGHVQRIVSLVVDAKAKRVIAVDLGNKPEHGPWAGYLRLKPALCAQCTDKDFLDAFYSDRAIKELFQPEPGCSDPTFAGAASDASGLTAAVLNLVGAREASGQDVGYGLSQLGAASKPVYERVLLPALAPKQTVGYRVVISEEVYAKARRFVEDNNKKRSTRFETGGLLWGYWDDAARVIHIADASGPPPDSKHQVNHFLCGTKGTVEEHKARMAKTHNGVGFVGMWHTHPGMEPVQSGEDRRGMTELVSRVGQNQRRAVMLIFGRMNGKPTAGLYVYESHGHGLNWELVDIAPVLFPLQKDVV